jgi:hypothetical protein
MSLAKLTGFSVSDVGQFILCRRKSAGLRRLRAIQNSQREQSAASNRVGAGPGQTTHRQPPLTFSSESDGSVRSLSMRVGSFHNLAIVAPSIRPHVRRGAHRNARSLCSGNLLRSSDGCSRDGGTLWVLFSPNELKPQAPRINAFAGFLVSFQN